MQTPRNARPPKRTLRFDCGKYVVRTIKREDASERWANWLSDPGASAMMNSPARHFQKSDIAEYIRQFDQRSRFLLGIFAKAARSHIGIIRMDVDHEAKECLLNIFIGEADYRSRGIMSEISVSTFDYLFESGAQKLTASTLARNESIKSWLIGAGWRPDPTRKQKIKSTSDGVMLDLSAFSLTRERWCVWKETSSAKRIRRRIGMAKS